MTFEHGFVLLFLLLPLAFAIWQWRAGAPKRGILLKAFCFAAVILALAEPRITVNETKVAVAVLVDTSASVSPADLQRASELAGSLQAAKGRHWMRVIPFARGSRELSSAETRGGWNLQRTSGESGNGTDLEAAIRDAIAAAPSGMVPRVVLISDGNENEGSVTRAAWLAQQMGVPVDTIPLKGRPEPQLKIESVSLPGSAFTGEKFTIDAVVSTPKKAEGSMVLLAEGKEIGRSNVHLEPGSNDVRVQTSLNVAGAVEVAGQLHTADLGDVRFQQAITLRRPRILYVSGDPLGTEQNLLATLKAGEFDVQQSNELPARQTSTNTRCWCSTIKTWSIYRCPPKLQPKIT